MKFLAALVVLVASLAFVPAADAFGGLFGLRARNQVVIQDFGGFNRQQIVIRNRIPRQQVILQNRGFNRQQIIFRNQIPRQRVIFQNGCF